MSRFNNVKTLIHVAETNDQEDLVNVIYTTHSDEYEELAEDIAFVLISMWALVPVGERSRLKDILEGEIVDVQLQLFERHHEPGS